MFYTVYKVTDLINKKVYVGVHRTKDLNDNYYGSGSQIKAAIKKHGLENFRKDIISIHTSSEAMFAAEATIVNREFLARSDTYNRAIGGIGSRRGKFGPSLRRPSKKVKKRTTSFDELFQRYSEPKDIDIGLTLEETESYLAKVFALNEKLRQQRIVELEHLGSPKIFCVYCGTEATIKYLKSYHLDNCQYKPSLV